MADVKAKVKTLKKKASKREEKKTGLPHIS